MRSDFLVHWTGKDIAQDPSRLTDSQRGQLVDRLADILLNGLWMTKPPERIEGNNGAWIEYEIPMACFTEIRLSQARSHAIRYGLLGIGVTRRFVLDRLGGPVHYVRNHAPECVVGNAKAILDALRELSAQPKYASLVGYFGINTSFMKAMSSPGADDFTYLDEQEWRIVHTHPLADAGKLAATGMEQPQYRIPVQTGDVRVVVFPDEQTRAKAKSDRRLRGWLQGPRAATPVLLTIPECEHF